MRLRTAKKTAAGNLGTWEHVFAEQKRRTAHGNDVLHGKEGGARQRNVARQRRVAHGNAGARQRRVAHGNDRPLGNSQGRPATPPRLATATGARHSLGARQRSLPGSAREAHGNVFVAGQNAAEQPLPAGLARQRLCRPKRWLCRAKTLHGNVFDSGSG